MNPVDEIIKSFVEAAAAGKPIKLINTYRGIPISHEAAILTINQGYVLVSAHPHQIVCLTIEGITHVRGVLFPGALSAQVMAVDPLKRQALLAEFIPASQSVGKRVTTRVQPKEPLEAEIFDGERRLPAKLADISTAGLGLFTFATHIFGEPNLEKGKQVLVDIIFPETSDVVRFQGKVASLVQPGSVSLHRVGFEITPDSQTETKINEYIERRKAEIMQELDRIYHSLCAKKTE